LREEKKNHLMFHGRLNGFLLLWSLAVWFDTNNAPYGTLVVFTNRVVPVPPDGENVLFMDGTMTLGTNGLHSGVAPTVPMRFYRANHFRC
jgi:hypothetical protein